MGPNSLLETNCGSVRKILEMEVEEDTKSLGEGGGEGSNRKSKSTQ